MNKSKFANGIFEQPWWLDVVAPNAWRDIIVQEDGKIIARWPIVEINGGVRMPQLTQTLGFWMAEDVLENDIYYNRRKEITNLLLAQLPHNRNVNISLNPSIAYFLPLYWHGFNISPRVSYRVDLLGNLDPIYNRFSKNVKRSISKADKKVNVEASDDIEKLLVLLDKTFNRQNMLNPWPGELVRNIFAASQHNNACRLLYAQDANGNIHSGGLFVYDEKVCYYLIGAADPAYRSSGSQSLLLWEGIQFAGSVSRAFDFEGSMIEGIEHFFRQFGGTPVLYYQIQKNKKSDGAIAFAKFRTYVVAKLKSSMGFDNWFKLKSILFKKL